MGQDPRELVQSITDGFLASDFDGFREALQASKSADELAERAGGFGELIRDAIDPEVEIGLNGIRVTSLIGERFSGFSGWLDFWRAWLEPWAKYTIAFSNWAEHGDTVLVTLDIEAEGRGSGVEVRDSIEQAWRVREGQVVALDMYASRDRALAALEGEAG